MRIDLRSGLVSPRREADPPPPEPDSPIAAAKARWPMRAQAEEMDHATFCRLVEEGQALRRIFDAQTASMRMITAEDYQRRVR